VGPRAPPLPTMRAVLVRYCWMRWSSQLPCMSSWFLSVRTSSRRALAACVSAWCSAPMARSVASSSAMATLFFARHRFAASRLRVRVCGGCAGGDLACLEPPGWDGLVALLLVSVAAALMVVVVWLCLELLLLLLLLLLLMLLSFSSMSLLAPATLVGAVTIGTCGIVNVGDELFRWRFLAVLLVFCGASGRDACLLFLLGWSSAGVLGCTPSWCDVLAAGGSSMLILPFLGEIGLWSVTGVEGVSQVPNADDMV
jgi:hypothetical protein